MTSLVFNGCSLWQASWISPGANSWLRTGGPPSPNFGNCEWLIGELDGEEWLRRTLVRSCSITFLNSKIAKLTTMNYVLELGPSNKVAMGVG